MLILEEEKTDFNTAKQHDIYNIGFSIFFNINIKMYLKEI